MEKQNKNLPAGFYVYPNYTIFETRNNSALIDTVYTLLADPLTLEVRASEYMALSYGQTELRYKFFSLLKGGRFRFPTGFLGRVLDVFAKAGQSFPLTWDPATYGRIRNKTAAITEQTKFPWYEGGAEKDRKAKKRNLNVKLFPRDYQCLLVNEAVTKCRGIIHSATASGKTGIMAMIIASLTGGDRTSLAAFPRTLVLVGSRSLVRQTREELETWLGVPVGEVSSRRMDFDGHKIVVGLVQTMAARAALPKIQDLLYAVDVLLIDEAHHVYRAAGTGGRGKSQIKRGQWHELIMRCFAPYRIALSGTPLKVDTPLQNWRLISATGPLFKHKISGTTLIEHGYAARPYIYFLPHNSKRVGKAHGWSGAVDRGIVHCQTRNNAILEATRLLVDRQLKTLVLVDRIDHGKILTTGLYGRNINAKFIHGGQDMDEQERLLDWFRKDEPGEPVKVLVSTRILGEGTNVSDIAAVVYARGGKAFVQLFQSIGRGIRPKGDRNSPGSCLVIIPEDKHNFYLAEHVKLLRVHLATEPGYRVANPDTPLPSFIDAVLRGLLDTELEGDPVEAGK